METRYKGLPHWAVNNKAKVWFTFSLLVLFGIASIFTMPRQADPNIKILQGSIVTYYPGANEEEVEKEVTEKIENYLFQSKQVDRKKTTSLSMQGVSLIKVELTPDVNNPTIVWNKLQHGLNSLPIPKATIQTEWADITQVIITVSSQVKNYNELQRYADTIQQALSKESEISGIQQVGNQQEEINVAIEKKKLIYYGIDLESILRAISSSHQDQPSVESNTDGYKIPISINGKLRSVQDVENVPIILLNGKVIRLMDVATIERKYQNPKALIGTTGKTLMLGINLRTNINEVAFGNKINAVLADLKKRLPQDLEFKTIVSEPEFVRVTVGNFAFEFFFVIAMVTIALILMSPLRTALISIAAAPISILMTIAFLRMLGMPLHQVTLAGLVLSLGMVVDDAIVVADNFRELRICGIPTHMASWKAAQQLMRPLLVRTVCIMVTFFPLAIFTVGLSKEFMITLPITVSLALGSSLLVAIFITPTMCDTMSGWKVLNKKKTSGTKSRKKIFNEAQNQYDRLIDWAFRNKRRTLVYTFLITIVGIALLGLVPRVFFPNADIDKFNILITMPRNANLEQTKTVVKELEEKIRKDSLVEDVTSLIGVSAKRFHVTYAPHYADESFAQLFIKTRDAKATRILSQKYINELENSIPGTRIQIRTLNFNQTEAPIEIHIEGNNLDTLKELGNKVCNILLGEEAVNFVRTSFENDYVGMSVTPKTSVPDELRVKKNEIGNIILAHGDGITAGRFHEGKNPISINVNIDSYNQNISTFKDLPVRTLSGALVPLGQSVDFSLIRHTGSITHKNGKRVLTVLAEAQKGTPAIDIYGKLDKQFASIKIPKNYTLSYGGEIETVAENAPGLLKAILSTIIGTFFLILFLYKSFVRATVIVLTFVLSLPGVAIGLLITGYPLGFTAIVGLLALVATVIGNGVTKLEFLDLLIREHNYSIEKAAKETARLRMRPVVHTSIVTALGLITMIAGGSPMWGPLATVVAFGLLYSVFITLIVMPVMLAVWTKEVKLNPKLMSSMAGIAALLLLNPTSVNGQEIDLKKCKELALTNNEIKKSFSELQSASVLVNSSKAGQLPQVSVGAYGFALGSPFKDILVPVGGVASLSIEQLLYAGGTMKHKWEKAELEREHSRLAFLSKVDQILFTTEKHYWLYQQLVASRQVISENQKTVERIHLETCERVRAGFNNKEDSLVTGFAVKENEFAQLQLSNQIYVQKILLCQIIGADTGTAHFKEVDTWDLPRIKADLDYRNNIGIKQAENRHEQLINQKVLANATGLPQIALSGGPFAWLSGAGKQDSFLPDNSFLSYSVFLSMRIPIFDGGQRKAQVRAIQHQIDAAAFDVSETESGLKIAIAKLKLDIEEAQENLRLAVMRKENSAAVFNLRLNEFKAGVTTVKSYLEARSLLEKSELQLLQARAMLILKYTEYNYLAGKEE